MFLRSRRRGVRGVTVRRLAASFADIGSLIIAYERVMNGVDLDGEIEQKTTKNASRQYAPDSNGVLFRVSEGSV